MAAPTITAVSPDPQVIGEQVTVTGTNFATVTAVTVGGVVAPFTIVDATHLTATVPTVAHSGPVAVTNPDGSATHTLGLLFPGPWRQPADLWGGWVGAAPSRQIWQTTFADTDPYPALPGTGGAPNASVIHGDSLGLGTSGWAVYRVDQDPTTHDYGGWGWEIVEWLVGVNFDADPPSEMAPVRPSTAERTAPHVVDFETELSGGGGERGFGTTAHGEPLGDVQIKVDLHAVAGPAHSPYATEEVPDATSSTPTDSSDIAAAELRAIRLDPADYSWSTPTTLAPSYWLTHTRLARSPLVLSHPVAAGSSLVAQSITPTRVWGSHNDDPADVTLDLTLTDLDPGTYGGYVVAVVPDLFVDNAPAALPAYVSATSTKPQVGKSAGGTGEYGVTGRLFYRPPRYRMLYDRPQVKPPLRQFPRDDTIGGAPRPGSQSRSVQASARQGWTGTYR